MLDFLIIALPAAAAALSTVCRGNKLRRSILIAASSVHLLLTLLLDMGLGIESEFIGWMKFDDPGKFFLTIASILYLGAAIYTYKYLADHDVPGSQHHKKHSEMGSEKVFVACMLTFLSTISLVAGSRHMGMLWVGMEATTLASAPIIYFNKNRYSLEAAWKYLLICSVGIGLALLGNIFIEISQSAVPESAGLMISGLISNARMLNPKWLEAAFIFFFVGYGTKMGLAPMHTWLPDAHSEAPSMISALMSGALLNCGFLGILRVHQILVTAGLGDYSRGIFLAFGLISLFIAAVFIIAQSDYKRMLAYSSIENMGIIAIGMGLGGTAVYGSLLHAVNHSFVKGALFLLSGNILAAYCSRRVDHVSGVLKALPVTGVLWVAMFLALSGIPPFGMFLSEFIIIREAIVSGSYATGIMLVVLLTAVFAGMSAIALKMAFGEPAEGVAVRKKEEPVTYLPSFVLGALTLILGVYIPSWLDGFIKSIETMMQ